MAASEVVVATKAPDTVSAFVDVALSPVAALDVGVDPVPFTVGSGWLVVVPCEGSCAIES